MDGQQGASHPATIGLGDVGGFRAVRQFCRVRRHGQHVHRLRREQSRRHGVRQNHEGAAGLRGIPIVLQIPRRSEDHHRIW